jgi:hypothetical protein
MSLHAKAAPWTYRSALQIITAPVARFLRRREKERMLPHDWREIERFRIEFELKKANIAITTRFKVM